jgi:hypothetical protein
VQVVSERGKPRHKAATHDPEGEEGERHGTPLPPDQAIGVSSKVAFSPSVSGSSGFDGLTHEPYFLRQSGETPWKSVGWRKRLTSIPFGRLTFRRTAYLSAITTMLIGPPQDRHLVRVTETTAHQPAHVR